MKKLIKRCLIGGYVLSQNVQEAISNGSASAGLLQGFGKVMEKALPTWILKAGTYISPLNYAAAISKGSINPKVGEEVISTWHPNLQLVARLGEIIGGGKVIKSTGNAAINTAAKAGNKTARAYIISKEINKATKNVINLKELSNQFIELYVTNPKGSGKVIHYDNGDSKSVFRNSGASIKDGKLVPGQTTKNLSNFTWWNKDNPYLNVHKTLGLFSPSRYIIVDLSLLFIHPLKAGKSVGQSDGAGRGFILPTEVVSETPVDLSNASIILRSPFGWWEKVKTLPSRSTKVHDKNSSSKVLMLDKNKEIIDIPIEDAYNRALYNKVPLELIKDLPDISDDLKIRFENNSFIPKHLVNPGKINEEFAFETIRRLQNMGYDLNSPAKIRFKNGYLIKTPKNFIIENAKKPSIMGYFKDDYGIGGGYLPYYDVSVIEPFKGSPALKSFHERNMHGTDGLLEDLEYLLGGDAVEMYRNFIDDSVPKNSPIVDGTANWKEARATIGELIRKYRSRMFKEKPELKTSPTWYDNFNHYIDAARNDVLIEDLRNTNGYGKDYGYYGPKTNPYFVDNLKYLMKYAPISIPFMFSTNKKEKGGKLCLIPRKN